MAKKPHPYKLLPGGRQSFLSLNNLILEGLPAESGLEKYNYQAGNSLYSLGIVKKLTAKTLPEYRINSNLIDFVEGRITKGDPRVYDLLLEVGSRLGAICLCMCLGKGKARRANPPVSRWDWAYWRQINHIYFAGGMAKGRCGRILKKRMEEIFERYMDKEVRLTFLDAAVTPSLLGCALRLEQNAEAVPLFDFGHSFVKRGVARFDRNQVLDIQEFAPRRVVHFPGNHRVKAAAINDFITDILLATYQEGNIDLQSSCNPLLFSMANNIIGNTFSNRGYYGPLSCYNNQGYTTVLSRQLIEKSGADFDIGIINDAEAVASLYSGEKNAAVITLGTGLGLGYPEGLPPSKKRLSTPLQPQLY